MDELYKRSLTNCVNLSGLSGRTKTAIIEMNVAVSSKSVTLIELGFPCVDSFQL